MKSILFPTDFSETAHNAFEFALHLAEDLGAEIKLLHVVPEKHYLQPYYTAPFIDVLNQERMDAALMRFEEYQEEAQTSLSKGVPVSVFLETGRAETVIESMSKNVDLIIMGTQGIRSSNEKVFGSVTAHTLQLAKCPVLSIPSPVKYNGIDHIMYASSHKDEDPVKEMMEFSEAFDAKLSFVHVELSEKTDKEFAYASYEKLVEGKNHSRIVGWYNFTHADVYGGLTTFINQNGVDIIAMLTRKRDLFGRLFEKSHTQEMALYSLTPLMVFQTE